LTVDSLQLRSRPFKIKRLLKPCPEGGTTEEILLGCESKQIKHVLKAFKK